MQADLLFSYRHKLDHCLADVSIMAVTSNPAERNDMFRKPCIARVMPAETEPAPAPIIYGIPDIRSLMWSPSQTCNAPLPAESY